ncbi:MAG TPA: hypothetical protein VH061_11650 [Solirubrobacteraceae bacterium]|nr:hypothetical protein [Solirubrobacteraceae bacterium]
MPSPADNDQPTPPPSAAAGIVYSGTGDFYIAEAIRSAQSSLRHNKLPHVIFSSTDIDGEEGLTVTRFEPSGNPYRDKIANMRRSPFERTIYLDSDTFVVDEIGHVMGLLDRYDMAVAFAPGYRGLEDPEVPKAFYEFNTGVLAWRSSERMDAFLRDWEETYLTWLEDEAFPGSRKASRGRRADQPAFRHCAWKHDIHVFALGQEYNFRLGFPATAVGKVRVIHGDHEDHEQLARQLNATETARFWPPPPALSLGGKVLRRLRRAAGRGPQAKETPRTAPLPEVRPVDGA